MLKASHAYYLKLGRGGKWAEDSIAHGRARIGWRGTPLAQINGGEWAAIKKNLQDDAKTVGAGTMDANALELFCASGEDDVWVTFHGSRSRFSQRIEIVTFLVQQTLLHQSLYGVEDGRARIRIVFTRLKECVQIQLLSVPEFEAFQNTFVDFIHGGINDQVHRLWLFLFHISHHRLHIRRDGAAFRVEQWWRWWQGTATRFSGGGSSHGATATAYAVKATSSTVRAEM